MLYEVTVDFHDNAVQESRTFTDPYLLGGFLEQIPNKIGFEMTGACTVHIKMRPVTTSND